MPVRTPHALASGAPSIEITLLSIAAAGELHATKITHARNRTRELYDEVDRAARHIDTRGMRVTPLLLLAACGGGSKTDAAIDSGPRCNPVAPFGTPVLVEGVNTDANEVTARLSPDELTIVYARSSTAPHDLYLATRTSIDGAFGNEQLFVSPNSIYSDVWPNLSPDGLALYFSSDRPNPGTFNTLRATRPTIDQPFGAATTVTGLDAGDITGYLISSGTAFYFASSVRPGLGGADLYRATIDANGTFGNVAAVTGLVNTSANEDQPVVTADELRVFFRRSVAGEEDIYSSARTTTGEVFGPASAVEGLAMAGVNEEPSWISPDGCRLYFFSRMPGGPMMQNIWVASRGL